MGPGGGPGPGPGPGPGGWGPAGPGPGPGPGGLFGGLCQVIGCCLNFVCCCWLLQDCFGGPIGLPIPPPGPIGPPPP
ncbi:hypothetical protein LINGRAHAP2_LOCUS32106 [Linum grandiflorum]